MSAFVSRHLYVSVSIFVRRLLAYLPLRKCLCACLAPVAASSGPHNPQERVVSFFTVTGCGPRRVAPGLQTNSVWPESLFFLVFASTDHRPRSPQEPRLRNGLGRGSVCLRIILPVGQGKGRGREIGMLKQNLIGLLLTWIKGSHIYSDQ